MMVLDEKSGNHKLLNLPAGWVATYRCGVVGFPKNRGVEVVLAPVTVL